MKKFAPLIVFALALTTLLVASHSQGNVRDEGTYQTAAEQYYGWYGELGDNILHGKPLASFTQKSVDHWFSFNHEHPALMKTLFGFSWRIFHKCDCPNQAGLHPIAYQKRHRTLSLLSEEQAMRLPTLLIVALMVMAIFDWARRTWSLGAGVVAAALSCLAPRFLFDSTLACFDAPIAAFWVLTVYAYYRALADRRWCKWAGIIFGLALATKHNAFFIPPVLIIHYLATQWRRKEMPRVHPVFLWMAIAGPLIYIACWPWLWFHTFTRFGEYAAFHLHHVYYNMEYLGVNYNKPPFPISFPYVMSLMTIPATTSVLGAIGFAYLVVRCVRKQREDVLGMDLLVLLNVIAPMAIITLLRQPIFGATKHWHATIPFVALLAGYAYHRLSPPRGLIAGALAAIFILPAAVSSYESHPYGLSHYTLFAGGTRGAASLGMNRQFWGYTVRGLYPYINAHAQKNESIYWHDTNQDQLNMGMREKYVRRDLRNSGMEEAGVKNSRMALVEYEKHFSKYEYWIWDFYGTTKPVTVLEHDGVPLVPLYERPSVK